MSQENNKRLSLNELLATVRGYKANIDSLPPIEESKIETDGKVSDTIKKTTKVILDIADKRKVIPKMTKVVKQIIDTVDARPSNAEPEQIETIAEIDLSKFDIVHVSNLKDKVFNSDGVYTVLNNNNCKYVETHEYIREVLSKMGRPVCCQVFDTNHCKEVCCASCANLLNMELKHENNDHIFDIGGRVEVSRDPEPILATRIYTVMTDEYFQVVEHLVVADALIQESIQYWCKDLALLKSKFTDDKGIHQYLILVEGSDALSFPRITNGTLKRVVLSRPQWAGPIAELYAHRLADKMNEFSTGGWKVTVTLGRSIVLSLN